MGYTPNPFNYTGVLPNQVQNDLSLANDNFNILAQAFVNNDPTTGQVKYADKVDGFDASQNPTANTIPVALSTGKLDLGWLPNFNKVEFTSSGTWTVPAGVSKLLIIVVGGGGGGGYGGSAAGGEGGYPGDSTVHLVNVSPGETLTITIGAGGSGGTSSTAGGNGGDTIVIGSVTSYVLTAIGGIGGRNNYVNVTSGLPGMSSIFGRGGRGGLASAGEDAPRPGAGGGGGGGGYNGGAGAPGFVRIIYFA